MHSLLPLNSTPLERAVEAASNEDLKVTLRTLYNPDTCPANLLYQLAWAWSVDRWDDTWPEAIKRSVIRSSFYVHAHKGTIGALRRVVEPFGYLIEVIEWFKATPPAVPGTFALKIGVSEATYYTWKKKFGDLGVSELKRLKMLEDENTRLKRIVANLTLDKQILQEVVRKKL